MKITAVRAEPLSLMFEAPFAIASSALDRSDCVLIRVETDEGLVGIGESVPGFEFTGETAWTVIDVVNEFLAPAIIGRDPSHIEAIVHHWQRELWTVGNQAAMAGLEMALWDLQGQAVGRPLCDLLGGRTRAALPEVYTFGWDEPEALARTTQEMRAAGVTVFKIKVGDTPERDEQRVAAVREAAGRECHLKADANQGWWDAKTAVRAIRLLEPYGLDLIEEPVRMGDLEAARWVRDRVDLPIALDETVRGPREALAAVRAGACDVIVLKLMKCGGILNALKVNAIAEAAGVSIMVGNMGESSLGMAAHLHVHSALVNAVYCDTDIPWRPGGYRDDIAKGLVVGVEDGVSMVRLPTGPGLGMTLNEEAVAAQRATRPWK